MIRFIIPHIQSFISGGNVFNKQIIDACKELGLAFETNNLFAWNYSAKNSNDLVIIDSIYLNEIDYPTFSKINGKKIVLVHLLPSMIDAGSIKFDRERMLYFDEVIVNSEYSKIFVQDTLLYKIVKVLSPYFETPTRNLKGIERKNYIMVANWLPVKQQVEFLSSLAPDCFDGINQIYIYGDETIDPNYYEKCINCIKDRSLSDFVIPKGKVSKKELSEVMLSAALLIDTSSFETYGMAVTEALICGIPILSLGSGNLKTILPSTAICDHMSHLVNRIKTKEFDTIYDYSLLPYQTDWVLFKEQVKFLLS